MIRNLPNTFVAATLRWLVFPRGRAYSAPYDRFLHDAAAVLLAPSAVRDRLIDGVHIGQPPKNQTARIEQALKYVLAAESAEKNIKQAVKDGIIRKHRSQNDVIAVDDFTPDPGLSGEQHLPLCMSSLHE